MSVSRIMSRLLKIEYDIYDENIGRLVRKKHRCFTTERSSLIPCVARLLLIANILILTALMINQHL